MKTSEDLKQILERIDHRGYPAYKDTRGVYQFGTYILGIDHVQGDPFAAPSRLHIQVAGRAVRIPKELYDSKHKKTAVADYLLRNFAKQLERHSFQAHGSGKSGIIQVTRCGQEVLERTACEIDEKTGDVTVRFEVGFPARGRTIQAGELVKILYQYLPACVEKALYYKNMDRNAVKQAAELSVDQEYIREQLKKEGMVAFVADGSILPRESGVSQRPMKDAVPFASPDSMRITMKLPYKGMLTGMGIRKGVTLIVGGGYHGKSTLLKALESGVYNHIPGDGREYVITDETAVKLRAEDGRSINHVDISLFIRDLPNKKDTTCFSTADASGSTSQAAAVIESIEAGTRAFLIDEDTSATNFMLRDDLMQRIVSRDKEPITPFIERARDLYKQAGISTVLVAGSSGAYFFIADTIIQMDAYRPFDITEMVKNACEQEASKPAIQAPGFKLPTAGRKLAAGGTGRAVGAMALNFGDSRAEAGGESQEEGENSSRSGRFGNRGGSASDAGRFERGRGGRREADRNSDRNTRIKVRVHDKHSFQVAKEPVDLRFVEQLADSEQTAALAQMVRYCLEKGLLERCTVQETVATLLKAYEADGLSVFSDASYAAMGLAMPRVQEIYACLNRFRG